MGVRRNFSRWGNADILFIIFTLLTISVPSTIILHWENICFSEHDYFRAALVEFSMNYKLCELYNTISYQNTHFLEMTPRFRCTSIALECCKWARMRFHCATVLVVLSICALRGNTADDEMQMDVNKSLYPFYTTKEMPHVTVTITKNASLAAIATYVSITTIYKVGYLQIFYAGHFFSSKYSHDL